MKSIFVTTSFEGVHQYPEAPEEVIYLRYPHRHIFHVRAQVEVFHDDRELEFIMVKNDLERYIRNDVNFSNNASCEMMADNIIKYLTERWPGMDEETFGRFMEVTVSEDGENGAIVSNY